MQPPKLPSDLKEVCQSYNPNRKKINVLSQYLLTQHEIEPVRLITKVNPKMQNVHEISAKEGVTHVPVISHIGLSDFKENPYAFQSEENQTGNENSYIYNSETHKNVNSASFHGSSEKNNIIEVSKNVSHNVFI